MEQLFNRLRPLINCHIHYNVKLEGLKKYTYGLCMLLYTVYSLLYHGDLEIVIKLGSGENGCTTYSTIPALICSN